MTALSEVFQKLKLYTDEMEYTVVKLPKNGATVAASIVAEISEPFLSMIVDKDEVTLIIPVDGLEEFKSRLRDPIIASELYRLITFDIELSMDTVGFMAEISRVLAEAGVSILPLAAYSRDHILVTTKQFQSALQALQKLIR